MSRLRQAAARLAHLEPGVVILASPLLLFPTVRPSWTAAALGAVLAVWLLHWIGAGRPGARTPLDGSLLLFVVMIPVAVWASAFPDLTLPKLTGLILGLAAFRAIVTGGRSPQSLDRATAVYLLLGLAMALVGLVGGFWTRKVPGLQSYLAHIPRLIEGLPGAEYGVHPNELGGTLILFLPVSLAAGLGWSTGRRGADRLLRLAAMALSLFLVALLFLTQSRSAWYGAVAGLGAMAWIYLSLGKARVARARGLILGGLVLLSGLVLLGGLVLLVFGLLLAGAQVAEEALPSTAAPSSSIVFDAVSARERSDPWGRALDAIAHFPITGSGLGTFRQIAYLFGPVPLEKADDDIAHAHNVFLQVALDLGIPGLVAYMAMLGITLWLCWRVARARTAVRYRWLALGILGSLVAFHVYGLTDTIAPGAKPGVAFWMLLALAVSVWSVESVPGSEETPPPPAQASK